MVVVGGRREGGREGGRDHQPVEPPPVSHCQHRTELDSRTCRPAPHNSSLRQPVLHCISKIKIISCQIISKLSGKDFVIL